MIVTASAPGKLLLLGDHAVVHGYPCLVTAVDQRIRVSVRKNGSDVFHLDAPEMGLIAYSKTIADLGKKELPKGVAFIEMLYRRFLERYPQKEGIVVTTASDFSSQFGFGSSSAVTVAFAQALLTLYGIELDQHQLFDLCYQAVLDVQGIGSGFDLAAAIWGGTLYYVTPAKIVEVLPVKKLPFVVGYTGIKADTPTLVRMVESAKKEHPQFVKGLFKQSGLLVEEAKQAMLAENWSELGQLMTRNQEILAQLKVSGIKLDEMIKAAQAAGAYGAKLSGAGGGDCMLALVNEHSRAPVSQALVNAGGTVIPVSLNAQGVRIEISEA